MKDLDKVIHQPVRTRIITLISTMGECDYNTIKTSLEITDGHMSTHMKELVNSGYVEAEKAFVDNKPKTTYRLSREGKKKFLDYIKTLKELLMVK